MYVVDASVWVSGLVPADVHHASSDRWLGRRVDEGELVVGPALVLAEVAGALARRTGLSEAGVQAISLMQQLPSIRLVLLDDVVIQRGARLAAQLRLRGADALYVAVAQGLGMLLVTWDEEQRERGRATVVTLSPQDLLDQGP